MLPCFQISGRSKRAAVLSVSLALSFCAASAWAYIPPARFILHKIAEQHLDMPSIRVRSRVSALNDQGQPTSTSFRETTIFIPKTDTLRSWASDDSGKILYTTELQGKRIPLATEILLDDNSGRMMQILQSLGIISEQGAGPSPATDGSGAAVPDLGAEKLGDPNLTLDRWNHTFAWVMGEPVNKDQVKPQLWIEKDSFQSLRLLAPANGESTDSSPYYDLQWDSYQSFGNLSYPRSATLYQTGKSQALLKAEVLGVDTNAPAAFSRAQTEGFTDAGNSAPSEVQDLIKTYYRFIR